jgi:putative ABC transport system ATP-binding protein
MADVYELTGVTKVFGDGNGSVRALDGLDLKVQAGEFLAVAGPSGSGKTTLLQLLGALDRPTAGEVLFEGRDMARLRDGELTRLRRDAIGFVFQQFNLIPTLTARENVEAALAPAGGHGADRLLEAVGLGNRLGHLPSELSGGEQQRVAIARALANDPRVLLADEPTGNLDSATGEEVLSLLQRLSDELSQTIVLITHNSALAERADRLVRLRDGQLDGTGVPQPVDSRRE